MSSQKTLIYEAMRAAREDELDEDDPEDSNELYLMMIAERDD